MDLTTLDMCIPFYDLVEELEKVSNSSTVTDKINRLTKYIKHFREKFVELHGTLESNDSSNGDSLFSIIRLLCPSKDLKRASYNFNTTKLSKMFAKILGLDKNSPDGRKLIEFKDPIKAGFGANDLGTTVFTILEKRFSHQGSKTDGPKLAELHHVLDQLARDRNDKNNVTQEEQVHILTGFVRKLTPLEGKWLIRILLKDLPIGLNRTQIYKLIHPKAADMMNTTDLEGVCKRLNDPTASFTDSEVSVISLFTFFKPMLCTRLDKIDDNGSKTIDNEDDDDDDEPSTLFRKKAKQVKKTVEPVKLPPPPFVLEVKWDGERFQIHYEYNSDENLNIEARHKFKYYSRNGQDYTSRFTETLSLRLIVQFIEDPPIKSFILDGEMMAWNKEKKTFTQKSGNIDVKTLSKESPHCPLFVAFDIVYYNGEALDNKPLNERLEYLRQVFNPEESTIIFSEQTLVTEKASVTEALNDAIDKLEEGLVVKTIDSVYQPGKRALDWLKIKPEYIEGHAVEDLDLLILGAYYSDSKNRRGDITNFLAGLVGERKNVFYPIATIGMGRLTYKERQDLVTSLREVCVNKEVSSVKHGKRRKPDLFVDPKKSVVIQVKASEIISSKEYELGYSLRFPRVTKVRPDKNWDEAMTVEEFTRLRQSCDGKLAKKSGSGHWFNKKRSHVAKETHKDDEDSSDENLTPSNSTSPLKSKRINFSSVKKSPVKSSLSMLAAASSNSKMIPGLTKVGNVKIKSIIFSKRVFCVIAGDNWKNEITMLLKSHGGEIVQNPTSDTFCIVAEKESHRIKNYESDGSYDITNGRIWIDKCILDNQFLDFVPEDLFFAKKSTKESFSKDYDKYGDSFTKPSTLHEVKTLVKNVMEHDNKNDKQSFNELKRQLDEELFPEATRTSENSSSKLNKWSFLSDCKIAFRGDHPPSESLITQIEFYRGEVAEDETESGVTHVVALEPRNSISPTKLKHVTAFVVNQKWLMDSLAKKAVRPEFTYLV